MSLENLIPALVLTKNKVNVWVVVRFVGGHQQEVTKEPSPDLDIQKFGFEGGQMPLQRRVPKFDSKTSRIAYKGINLDTLQKLLEKRRLIKKLALIN